jgi:hypothetical protein
MKILFRKQLFDLEVKGQGLTEVITVCATPPYDHALQEQHRQFVDRRDDSTRTMIVDKFYHFHHHRGITLIADPS